VARAVELITHAHGSGPSVFPVDQTSLVGADSPIGIKSPLMVDDNYRVVLIAALQGGSLRNIPDIGQPDDLTRNQLRQIRRKEESGNGIDQEGEKASRNQL
jgi:hypothetical protein